MVKWFSGGQERKKVALKLLIELYQSADHPVLKDFFKRYIGNLNEGISVPAVPTVFNLELSGILLKNKIILTEEQKKKVDEIRKLSNIRYGYPN